jgi:hypothetical protein
MEVVSSQQFSNKEGVSSQHPINYK